MLEQNPFDCKSTDVDEFAGARICPPNGQETGNQRSSVGDVALCPRDTNYARSPLNGDAVASEDSLQGNMMLPPVKSDKFAQNEKKNPTQEKLET